MDAALRPLPLSLERLDPHGALSLHAGARFRLRESTLSLAMVSSFHG